LHGATFQLPLFISVVSMAANLEHFRSTPKYSGIDTSELIRDTALRLFALHGYQTVSLRQIAEEVGINAGSLYYHIESKAELLYELIDQYENFLSAEVCLPRGKRNSATVEILRYVRSYVSYIRLNAELALLSIRELCCLGLEHQNLILLARQEHSDHLIEIIRSGVKENLFSTEDLSIAALSIRAIIERITLEPTNSEVPLETLVRKVQSITLKALGASPS